MPKNMNLGLKLLTVLLFFMATPLKAVDLFDPSIFDKIGHSHRFGYELEINYLHAHKILSKVQFDAEAVSLETAKNIWLEIVQSIVLRRNLPESAIAFSQREDLMELPREELIKVLDNVFRSSPKIKVHMAHFFETAFKYVGKNPLEKAFFQLSKTVPDESVYREYVLKEEFKIKDPQQYLKALDGGLSFLGIEKEILETNRHERTATYHHHISREEDFSERRVYALHDFKISHIMEFHGVEKINSLSKHFFVVNNPTTKSFATNIREPGNRIEEKLHIFPPKKQLIFTLNLLNHPDENSVLKHIYETIWERKSRPELVRWLLGRTSTNHYKTTGANSPFVNEFYALVVLKRLAHYTNKHKELAEEILKYTSQQLDKDKTFGLKVFKNFLQSSYDIEDKRLLEEMIFQLKKFPEIQIGPEVFEPGHTENLKLSDKALIEFLKHVRTNDSYKLLETFLSPSKYTDTTRASYIQNIIKEIDVKTPLCRNSL